MSLRRTGTQGYTLIELALVIFLIGIFLSLSVPRLRETMLTNPLHATIRRLTNVMSELRGLAARQHQDYLLHFEFTHRLIWWAPASATPARTETAKKEGIHLADEVELVDVWTGSKGKSIDGDATIRFTLRGYAEQSMIHLRDTDDENFSLEISPFLDRVIIHDKYVDVGESTR